MSGDEQPTTGPAPSTRRALLAGAGALGASVVLSACTTDANSGSDTGSDSSGGQQNKGGKPAAFANTADIPVGGGKIYADAGAVITQPTQGDFKAFSNICTHQGCPVTQVDGGTINCKCHNSKFSIEDGTVQSGPAKKGLTPLGVTVEGDRIPLDGFGYGG
jgi:Rieske Fe-S protein